MTRQQLALGTHGAVSIAAQYRRADGSWTTDGTGRADRYRATTRYRARHDGSVRQLTAFGKTKGEAKAKLNRAIADVETEHELRQSKRTRTTLADVGAEWLAGVTASKRLAERSRTLYVGTWERCFAGSDFAALPLHEANTVPAVRTFLQGIADERGEGMAKTARSVLSAVLGLAVDKGIVPMNATRSIRPVKGKRKATVRDTRRALTRAERDHLVSVADADERAQAQDVADIVAWLAGTGVRIGEALAQRWEDVDLDDATAHVRGSKTEGSDRVIPLPAWLVKRLRARRKARGNVGLVFPSPGTRDRDKPRDVRNVARIFRVVLDEAGFDWATPHTLRRTVATLIHEAGRPVTEAQAQLGHADASMTMRVYLAKRPEPSRAAAEAL